MARKAHEKTKDKADIVIEMAKYGMPHDRISLYLKIDKKTLYKYYRDELDEGMCEADFKLRKSLYERAFQDTTMGIFIGKTRLGLSEKTVHQVEMPDNVYKFLARDDGE